MPRRYAQDEGHTFADYCNQLLVQSEPYRSHVAALVAKREALLKELVVLDRELLGASQLWEQLRAQLRDRNRGWLRRAGSRIWHWLNKPVAPYNW
jgi:hypothetical protein